MKKHYVYILASKKDGVLYIGVTGDLVKRVFEHRQKETKSFTKQYFVSRLVYYEMFGDVEMAIQREKQMKKWRRAWKVRLIEEKNPDWRDLYGDLL